MEHLQALLSNAVKLEEAELQLPMLKRQHGELKEIVADRKHERDWAILTAKNLEDPGFFQRLLGRVAEKQEKAQTEARQATAAYEESSRELDELEYLMISLQEACTALSGSREAYAHARAAFLENGTVDGVRKLREQEIEAFRPVALELLRQIRKALYAARGWMQKDLRPRYSGQPTRRMEFLHLADEYAAKLENLLVYFPEGSVTLGASMSGPSSYVHSVSTNLSQIDLLNIAIEQSQRVQAQLEGL